MNRKIVVLVVLAAFSTGCAPYRTRSFQESVSAQVMQDCCRIETRWLWIETVSWNHIIIIFEFKHRAPLFCKVFHQRLWTLKNSYHRFVVLLFNVFGLDVIPMVSSKCSTNFKHNHQRNILFLFASQLKLTYLPHSLSWVWNFHD